MGNSVEDFKGGNTWKYRDRLALGDITKGTSLAWYGTGPPSPYTGNYYSAGSSQRCIDTSHPQFYSFMRNLHKLDRSSPSYRKLRNLDIGGSFSKESVSLSMPRSVDFRKGSGVNQSGYIGVAFPSTMYNVAMLDLTKGRFPAIPTDLGLDKFQLVSYGSSAVAKSIPDIPDFSLFRFVGELREGLPKVPIRILAKEKKLRATGGEYLNFQFGIAPLVSDLQHFLEAVQHPKFRAALQSRLDKEFRVRKVLDKGSTSTQRPLTSAEMSVGPAAGGTGYLKSTRDWRVWSSCSFAYHQLTELDRLLADLDNVTGGLGVLPTAIDIWNLIPWSWLVDWFTNFNQVMTNLSYLGRDGLYLRYGYVMATYTDVQEHYRAGTAYNHPYSTIGTLKTERKYRVGASPFGFGYTWKDFNPFQLSILGALGVSRLRF